MHVPVHSGLNKARERGRVHPQAIKLCLCMFVESSVSCLSWNMESIIRELKFGNVHAVCYGRSIHAGNLV